MSCDPSHDFTNFGGAMGLGMTRPLHSFFGDPRTVYQRHDQKPAGETPPPTTIPWGPQIGPGFTPAPGVPAATYAPGYADDGWVPGGLALRLGA